MSSSVAFLNRTNSQNAKIQSYISRIQLAKTSEEKEAIRKEKRKYENNIDEEYDLQVFLKQINNFDVFA